MFVLKLYRYLSGYVIILIKGTFAERFLNLCARRHIKFWSAQRVENGVVMRVMKDDFHRLKNIAKNSGCHVRIKKKVGLPFLFFRYRKRTALYFGIGFFIISLFVLSLFIWSVEVVGDESIDRGQIRQLSAEAGLKSGVLRSKIDAVRVKNYIMTERDDLAFVGVSIKGSKAVLEVKERAQKPDIIDDSMPCNLVAGKTGEIAELAVYNGRCVVTVGQGVKEGDLLVSGVIDNKDGGTRLVHAQGEVYANTYYEVSREVPFIEVISQRTGEQKNCYSLQILDFVINLKPESSIDFKNYDKITEKHPFPFLGSDTLAVIQDICYETRNITYVHTADEAEQIARTLCDESFYADNPGAVSTEVQAEVTQVPGGVKVNARYTCRENIARQKEIEYTQGDS